MKPTPQKQEAAGNPWLAAAQAEVEAVRDELPAAVRARIDRLPVSYYPRPTRAMMRDGLEPDLLGLFVGPAFDESPDNDVPAEILIFFDNLRDFAADDLTAFRQEVRTTYLHEIGHYLGLEENDLEERELD